MYINRTVKCLKRLQKRSIDDNLRQLVVIRQDRVLVKKSTCFFTSESGFFFFTFPKKWVVRAMGNETVYGDGLTRKSKTIKNDVLRFSLRKMLPVKCPLVSLKAS